MSTDAIEALSFFFGVAITAAAAAFAWAKWLKHRYDELRIERAATADAERIAKLENTLEALAIEVERIGEAQRYAVKLLEERLPKALPGSSSPQAARGGQIITPH